MEKSVRYRVNVSTSVKGIKTYDCTVDIKYEEGETEIISTDHIEQEILTLSDSLVAALGQRYPAPVEVK